uniref:Fe2OG dioxygenase domain-containing protein n=1 Tax=Chenopodium quinoa TaxID=63459 RepID=A0A803MDK3_CHEQI
MNYYPPCPQLDKVIGLTPHSDSISLITILLEVNDVEGLQIMKDNNCVSIKPLSNVFVMSAGDVLEVRKFASPIFDLVTSTTPARFKRIRAIDYNEGFLAHPLDGGRYLDVMTIVENDQHFGNVVAKSILKCFRRNKYCFLMEGREDELLEDFYDIKPVGGSIKSLRAVLNDNNALCNVVLLYLNRELGALEMK